MSVMAVRAERAERKGRRQLTPEIIVAAALDLIDGRPTDSGRSRDRSRPNPSR
jgi:hypothetical protein